MIKAIVNTTLDCKFKINTMKTSILLPTDFSDNAWSAAVYALRLYADVECDFYFLHSTHMQTSTMSNISNKLQNIINKNATAELLEIKQMAERASDYSNHTFNIILSSDNLIGTIETSINKHQIDLVIMGTKGATGAKEFIFGSNTVRVIKKLKRCAVLIIPDEYDFIIPTQIAFPTDYKRFFDDKELRPLKKLAEIHNSQIKILHINVEKRLDDIQDYNLNMLKSYLSHYDHSFHWMPNYAKKTHEINDFNEELGIDILAMVNYKHSFIESIIKEPVIKKIGFQPIIPFLVIPE